MAQTSRNAGLRNRTRAPARPTSSVFRTGPSEGTSEEVYPNFVRPRRAASPLLAASASAGNDALLALQPRRVEEHTEEILPDTTAELHSIALPSEAEEHAAFHAAREEAMRSKAVAEGIAPLVAVQRCARSRKARSLAANKVGARLRVSGVVVAKAKRTERGSHGVRREALVDEVKVKLKDSSGSGQGDSEKGKGVVRAEGALCVYSSSSDEEEGSGSK